MNAHRHEARAVTAYVRKARRLQARMARALVGLLLCGACAPSSPPMAALPAVEGLPLASALEQQTRLAERSQVRFDWSLMEQGSRLSGQGVTRVEPPYRARLDLFLGDGTTAAAATLVDRRLSLPPGLPEGLIPPPDLLWAALGVFRPGPGAELLGARRAGETLELRYGYPDGSELRYLVEGGQIREAELREGGHTVHKVTLQPGQGERYPKAATYRNVAAFRELKLTTRSIENVASFPSDIWSLEP